MAGNDRVKAGYDWIEVELVEIVHDIESGFTDLHHLGGLETGRPGTFVDVSADRNNGRDGSEPLEDGEGADVPEWMMRSEPTRAATASDLSRLWVSEITPSSLTGALSLGLRPPGGPRGPRFSVWLSLDREDMNGLDHQLHPIANLESRLIDRLCCDD